MMSISLELETCTLRFHSAVQAEVFYKSVDSWLSFIGEDSHKVNVNYELLAKLIEEVKDKS